MNGFRFPAKATQTACHLANAVKERVQRYVASTELGDNGVGASREVVVYAEDRGAWRVRVIGTNTLVPLRLLP